MDHLAAFTLIALTDTLERTWSLPLGGQLIAPTKRSLCRTPCSETDVLPSPWTDLGGDSLEREEGQPNGREDPCGKTHFSPVNRNQHDMVEAGEADWLRLRLTNTRWRSGQRPHTDGALTGLPTDPLDKMRSHEVRPRPRPRPDLHRVLYESPWSPHQDSCHFEVDILTDSGLV